MFYVKIFVSVIFLICINVTDIKGYKIKNKIVFPTVIAGLLLGLASSLFLDSLYGMLVPLILFPLYALRMLGAGDIKALCALGALFGFDMSLKIMLLSFIAGGVIAFGFMLFNRNFLERFGNLFKYIKMCFFTRSLTSYDFGGKRSCFRFSYAITAGTALAFLYHYGDFWVVI